MNEPDLVLTVEPGAGAPPSEEGIFSSHGEGVDRALDEERRPMSPMVVSALASTVAALGETLCTGVRTPYAIRTPQEAAHVATQVESASEHLGKCLDVLASWAGEQTPDVDTAALVARSRMLQTSSTQRAIKTLSHQPSSVAVPTTAGEVINGVAEHLQRLGYRVVDVYPGDEDPDDSEQTPTQLRVELDEERSLYIIEDLMGWACGIWAEPEGPPLSAEVDISSDNDPRAIAELGLAGLALPVPAVHLDDRESAAPAPDRSLLPRPHTDR